MPHVPVDGLNIVSVDGGNHAGVAEMVAAAVVHIEDVDAGFAVQIWLVPLAGRQANSAVLGNSGSHHCHVARIEGQNSEI